MDVSCIPESCCCSYSFLYFLFFLSLQFSIIKKKSIGSFLGNCEALKVETSYKHEQWLVVLCIPNSGCCFLLYPWHLCQGVYSFRLSVHPFVRTYVRSFVCSLVGLFVCDSVPFVESLQSFTLKFLKWGISQQPLIRKHSYLDHRYPGGSAFIP